MSFWVAGSLLVGTVVSSEAAKSGAKNAANVQGEASERGTEHLENVDARNRESLGKYSGNVTSALDRRRALQRLGSEQDQMNAENRLYSGQAYEAGIDRVVDNVNRRSSVNGGIYGGNRLAEFANRLKQFDYATQGNYMNQLGSEVGIGLSADSAAAGVSQSNAIGQANLMQAGANGVANAHLMGGQAASAGYADLAAGIGQFGGSFFSRPNSANSGWQGSPQIQGGYYA